MDRDTALQKIKKCLNLAKSCEPHEAAAALRQAQKLMSQFGIDHPELISSEISEAWSQSGSVKKPATYEVHLAVLVAGAFECDVLHSTRIHSSGLKLIGGYLFLGKHPHPDIASYTFTVLQRQLAKTRAAYIKTALKRYSKNKTPAADQFCLGWVIAASKQIHRQPKSDETQQAISLYTATRYDEIKAFEPRKSDTTTYSMKISNSINHQANGWKEGKKVVLNTAVTQEKQLQLL